MCVDIVQKHDETNVPADSDRHRTDRRDNIGG
jgi:hypothetical protein